MKPASECLTARAVSVQKTSGSTRDMVIVEEPLTILLGFGPIANREQHQIATTMRTPGDDEVLAVGFLFSEGILERWDQVRSVGPCGGGDTPENIIRVELHTNIDVPADRLVDRRASYSSCGVCGRKTIDDLLEIAKPLPQGGREFDLGTIRAAAEQLSQRQALFQATGSSHAAALINADGMITDIAEDAGRHNALDKLIGAALREDRIPLLKYSILLSGRVSFEMVAKALRAGCPGLFAMGGPTSLAIDTAQAANMTLGGFVRGGQFNLYSSKTGLHSL